VETLVVNLPSTAVEKMARVCPFHRQNHTGGDNVVGFEFITGTCFMQREWS